MEYPTKAAYWQAQVNAWQASKQTQQAFCKANDLNYYRFGYWLKKFREQATIPLSQTVSTSAFVPIVGQTKEAALHLQLPNGIQLHGINQRNVAVVKQLLDQLA